MRITASADIAAPIAAVFAAATDHEGFVREARRRGAEVRRIDGPGGAAVGAGPSLGDAWRASFPLRGRERRIEIRLARLEPPTLVETLAEGGGFAGGVTAELLALSRGATRLRLVVEVRARTLPGRLVLQGMRLARGRMERRARERLAAWAREVEKGAPRPAKGGAA